MFLHYYDLKYFANSIGKMISLYMILNISFIQINAPFLSFTLSLSYNRKRHEIFYLQLAM